MKQNDRYIEPSIVICFWIELMVSPKGTLSSKCPASWSHVKMGFVESSVTEKKKSASTFLVYLTTDI